MVYGKNIAKFLDSLLLKSQKCVSRVFYARFRKTLITILNIKFGKLNNFS